MVMIVDDPKKGLDKNNIVFHKGDGTPCQHLRGNKPGEYSCVIHNEPYYKETPCFRHNQIEERNDCECKIGRYVLGIQEYANQLVETFEKE